LRPATLFSPRTELNGDRVMSMAYGHSCSLCFFPFDRQSQALVHNSSFLHAIKDSPSSSLLFSFRFFISFRLFTLSSSINDHIASSSSPLHSRASTTMCREFFVYPNSSIRLWAVSDEVLSHDSSPRWFVWYSGVPASQQNLEDTGEICADSRYHFDHGSGSQVPMINNL
ncbi:unnamed protein product, partial [Brassica rapa subsp. trilocularis]